MVVIIGVLAAVALPSYRIQMLKMKNQEAIRILMVLWEAQKDYYRENGAYLGYTSNLDEINTNLNVGISPPKNFVNVIVGDNMVIWMGVSKKRLAAMEAKDGSYLLLSIEDGSVACWPLEVGFLGGCKKMGFPRWE